MLANAFEHGTPPRAGVDFLLEQLVGVCWRSSVGEGRADRELDTDIIVTGVKGTLGEGLDPRVDVRLRGGNVRRGGRSTGLGNVDAVVTSTTSIPMVEGPAIALVCSTTALASACLLLILHGSAGE